MYWHISKTFSLGFDSYLRHSSKRLTESRIAQGTGKDCVDVLTLFAARTAVACIKVVNHGDIHISSNRNRVKSN